MKKLRVLVLMHESLVPPESTEGYTEDEILEWKTEFDVVNTLRDNGHEVLPLGVYDDLGDIRRAIKDFKPHVHFNLLEEFHGVGVRGRNSHNKLIFEKLNWKPTLSLESGIDKTYEWISMQLKKNY